MVWKALEALGMLSEALGSFDVNTVCPLPGSWINHGPVCICCTSVCDSVHMCCSLWQAFPESRSYLNAFFAGFAESAYGHVVFSR